MMSRNAIVVEHLSKRYRLGQMHTWLLSERIANLLKLRRQTRPAPIETFWALRDVNFSVATGDVVGIIGRNGAGKSTLLKVLSRLTAPTEGKATIRGRLASLLEVGTGFHPELTGRENIYMNGTILGMRRKEIDRQFDEIVAFSGVEAFLETPVKRYSSGMYVRLAFAVAAHVETDILIVDEVLAVGDAEFQRRCLGKMRDVAHGGRTVLFVSHNLPALRSLCNVGIVLDRGAITAQGSAEECLHFYEQHNAAAQGAEWRRPADAARPPMMITAIESVLTGDQPDLKLALNLVLESTSPHPPAMVAVDIADASGIVVMQAVPRPEGFLPYSPNGLRIHIDIDLPPLVPGRYLATLWCGDHYTHTLDHVAEAVAFEVLHSPMPGRVFPHTTDHGFIVPPSTVRVES